MPSLFSEEDIRRHALEMSVEEFEKNYLEAKLNRIREEFMRVYGSMKDKLSAEQTNKLVEGFCKQIKENYEIGEECIRKFFEEKTNAAIKGWTSPEKEDNMKIAINNLYAAAEKIKKELEQYKK